MVQVVERIERDHEVQDPLLSEIGGRDSGHLVLECDCGERMTLVGSVVVRRWRSGRLVIECGCGESFVLDGLEDKSPVGELSYTWLEDYLERLGGKEARHEYYARLEQAAPL